MGTSTVVSQPYMVTAGRLVKPRGQNNSFTYYRDQSPLSNPTTTLLSSILLIGREWLCVDALSSTTGSGGTGKGASYVRLSTAAADEAQLGPE